jgi:hypothetical protein
MKSFIRLTCSASLALGAFSLMGCSNTDSGRPMSSGGDAYGNNSPVPANNTVPGSENTSGAGAPAVTPSNNTPNSNSVTTPGVGAGGSGSGTNGNGAPVGHDGATTDTK